MTVSNRTIIRDLVVDTFRKREGQDGMRLNAFDVSTNYLTPEECKRFPTYCVIVTNETPGPLTQAQRDCVMTLMIVIYAKHEKDVRADLDAAIEDAYDTLLLAQAGSHGAWKWDLQDLSTDEGTTIAKPHAQAIQRWNCHHGRATRAA